MLSADIKTHLWYPLLLFAVVALLFEYNLWDIPVADWLYHFEGDSWSLRNNLFTSTVMHTGGRDLVKLMVFGLLLTILYHWRCRRYVLLRAELYLLACFAITTLAVAALKHLTHVSCPWGLVRYGGGFPYISVFSALPPATPHGACFPAGHASAGYAWVALYYYFRVTAWQYRWYGLFFGLLTGLGFDIAQQLRGAHFVSHGLWTLGIAWFVATSLYFRVYGNSRQKLRDTGPDVKAFA